MDPHDVGWLTCAHCDKRIRNHQWGRVKAGGWLVLKDETTFCPDHIPEWYWEWKARKDKHGRG